MSMTRNETIVSVATRVLAALVVADAQLPITDRSTHKELVDESITLAVAMVDELRERRFA